jgi:hypothetical protein
MEERASIAAPSGWEAIYAQKSLDVNTNVNDIKFEQKETAR